MTEKKTRKKKKTVFDLLRTMILMIAILVFCYSGFRLFSIYREYKVGENEYKELEELVQENGNTSGKKEPVISVTPGTNGETERYMESPVNFKELKEINKDVVGWINVEALDINYPVVQGKDNEYYLHRTFKKVDNFAGSIFVEALNTPGFKDENTIIYGHNMKDGSMFGTLKKFREQETIDKSPYIWIYTPKMSYKYQIFSGHEVGAVSGTYQMRFSKDKKYKKYLDDMIQYSEIKTDISVGVKDKIITLSTCTGNEATRFVVQAKLVDSVKVK